LKIIKNKCGIIKADEIVKKTEKRIFMKKLTIFETNGKRFDSYEDALKYEKLCKKVDGIMSQLLPRTEEIEHGTDYNKHNKETLNGCFKAFCKECAKQMPDMEALFIDTMNGIRHMSHIGRVLSDCGYDFPCLYDAYQTIVFKNFGIKLGKSA